MPSPADPGRFDLGIAVQSSSSLLHLARSMDRSPVARQGWAECFDVQPAPWASYQARFGSVLGMMKFPDQANWAISAVICLDV